MFITVNQVVQLLWIHYCDPTFPLNLLEEEVWELTLELVARWDSLVPSVYVSKLITQDKGELIDHLRDDPGKTIFN